MCFFQFIVLKRTFKTDELETVTGSHIGSKSKHNVKQTEGVNQYVCKNSICKNYK
jgi:hypothetical protein